ncbi:MAG: TSCPD domain-containing protein, partial [Nitrospinae bacterium]|nr:TSCPD domain-containing protein [Nitrospinota bacterium]
AYHGHIEDIAEIPEDARKTFVTAHGITPEWHLRMQAAFQRSTDNAVSKTVNFSNSATVEEVAKVYMLAYHLECKGVTIYRDGSRDEQVLSTGSTYEKDKAGKEEKGKGKKVAVRPRPVTVYGSTHRVTTGCGNMYVTINHDEEGRALELFTHLGKAGGCAASQTESIGRLVSLALRAGIDIQEIKGQMTGIICHQPAWDKNERIFSCADAIAKAIKAWSESVASRVKPEPQAAAVKPTALKAVAGGNGSGTLVGQAVAKPASDNGKTVSAGACPDCGGALQSADGCMLCSNCGYSKC